MPGKIDLLRFPCDKGNLRVDIDVFFIQPEEEPCIRAPAIIAEFVKDAAIKIVDIFAIKHAWRINQVDRGKLQVNANVPVTRIELDARCPVNAVNRVILKIIAGDRRI